MLGSKSNRITLYVSAFLVIALVLFAILRDTSNQITLEEAKKNIENNTPVINHSKVIKI